MSMGRIKSSLAIMSSQVKPSHAMAYTAMMSMPKWYYVVTRGMWSGEWYVAYTAMMSITKW